MGSNRSLLLWAVMDILFYFGIFFSAGLAQWEVCKRMAREVNQHLPDSEQFSTSRFAFSPRSSRSPINQIKLWRLHRRFFPASYLPFLYLAIWVLLILFWGLCLQFDRSHPLVHG